MFIDKYTFNLSKLYMYLYGYQSVTLLLKVAVLSWLNWLPKNYLVQTKFLKKNFA